MAEKLNTGNSEENQADAWASLSEMARDNIDNKSKPETAPSSQPEKPEEPQWDPRLTEEQRLDMLGKGIDEPVGPEYQQALREFGLDPIPEAKAETPEQPQWDPRLTQEQREELEAEGIAPGDQEYRMALINYGIDPDSQPAKPEEPQWDPRLTEEQRLDMLGKGIDEPVGPEYQQALREFGLDPIQDTKATTPETQPKPEPQPEQPKPETPTETPKTTKEQEERARAEAEARARAEAEERARAEAEEAERQARIKEIIEEKDKLEKEKAFLEKGPLTAINADFTYDKKELAHDLAENALNEEVAKGKLIKRLWKGTLFKKYYEKKYTSEFMKGERTVDVDGKQLTVDNLIDRRKDSAIARFVLGATEDMRYIHEKIGKKNKDGTYDGEKLTEADEKTTAEVKNAIEKFATAKIPEGGNLEDLKREFANDIARLKAEAKDDGRDADSLMIDNYLGVAIQARERAEHGIAIERVMEGFKVYNADVRDGIRTEAHRDNIDKVTNWLENHTGGLVPPQVIAGAVSIASALTQTGARAVAGAAGGMLVSGAISGLKERNRVTEDRARMLRDAANGLEYSGTSESGEDLGNRRARKTAKYEARIGGTLYDLQGANTLADNIEAALRTEGEGRSDAVLRAIAEARVRIDLSDSEQKDLISYSSADKRGDERLRLDRAVIQAEKALSPDDVEKLKTIRNQITKEITGEIDEKDSDFRRQRAAMAAKKAGKTLAIGAATFFVSQEVMAALDPGKIGLLEKAGIIKTENRTDASETILAGLAGPRVRTATETTPPVKLREDQQAEIQRLEEAGYNKTQVSKAWTETKTGVAEVKPADSTAQIRVKYDGWANNGTKVSDGNELRAYISQDGKFFSGMSGNSTMGNQVINYENMAAAGKIKGYVTIGGAKFELASTVDEAGRLTWGDGNGVFTTTTGETIRALGQNGEKLYKYFEIAVDNGVGSDGLTHIVPLATDVGRDTFTGTIQQVTETLVEHPAVYSFTKTITREIPRAVTTAGIAFAPETARTGLGATRARATEQEPNGGGNTPTEQEPNGGGDTPTEGEPNDGNNPSPAGAGESPENGSDTPAETTEEPNSENPADTEEGQDGNPTNPTTPPTNTPPASGTNDGDYRISIDSTGGPEMHSGEEARRIIEGDPNAENWLLGGLTEQNKRIVTNVVGGPQSVRVLTEKGPMSSENQERWSKWWGGLDKRTKAAISNIVDRASGPDTGIRSWIKMNRNN